MVKRIIKIINSPISDNTYRNVILYPENEKLKRIDVSIRHSCQSRNNDVRSFANRETSTLIINVSWKQLRVSIGIVGCVNTNLYIPSNYFKLVGNQPSIKTLVIRFAIRYYAISMFRPDRPLPPPLSNTPFHQSRQSRRRNA